MRTLTMNARLIFFLSLIILVSACGSSKKEMSGFSMKTITKENVHGVFAADENTIWICGAYGTVYNSIDGGDTWQKQETGIKDNILVGGLALDSKTALIVGVYGIIIRTDDGGKTWQKLDPGTTKHLFGISFLDKNTGWIVGEWGTILHTVDGGKTWKSQMEEQDKTYNNVYFVDRQNGWVIGEQGIILHTADGGNTWNTQMPKSFERESLEDLYENQRPALFDLSFTDAQNGLLCGIEGAILKTTDGGNTWIDINSKSELTFYSLSQQGTKACIVGDKGAYIISNDSGTAWEPQDDVIASKFWFHDICFTTPEKGWVVGQAGTVVHTADGGKTWEFLSGLSYDMEFFTMPEGLEFKGMVTE